jgi:hypothetical protein
MAFAAGVLLTSQDVTNGTPSTLQDFRRELSKFHRDALLQFCGLANNLLFRDPRRFYQQIHDEFVRRFLPNEISRLIAPHPGVPPRVVFHRRQLLFLAKEALFNCTPSGGLWHAGDPLLARVLLMATDQLAYNFATATDPLDKLVQDIAEFIAIGEDTGFSGFRHRIIRPFLMVTRFLKPEGESVCFDIPKLFAEAVGLPITTYWAATFAVISRLLNFDLETFSRDRNSFGVDEAYYRTTKITEGLLVRFFEEIAFDPYSFAQNNKMPAINDLSCFKAKPMFRFSGRIYPIDFSFAAAKCESGVFWSVHNHLASSYASSRRQKRLYSKSSIFGNR